MRHFEDHIDETRLSGDARRKDERWNIGGDYVRIEEAQLACLMDIRDELKTANNHLKQTPIKLDSIEALINSLADRVFTIERQVDEARKQSKHEWQRLMKEKQAEAHRENVGQKTAPKKRRRNAAR